MSDITTQIWDSISNILTTFFKTNDEQARKAGENTDFLTWTPSEDETRKVVIDFLKSEPGWIENAIKRDPALLSKVRETIVENDFAGMEEIKKLLQSEADGNYRMKTKVFEIEGEEKKEEVPSPVTYDEIKRAAEKHQETFYKVFDEAIKEVLTYQGLHAIAWHKMRAHRLYEKKEYAEARKISQGVRRLTAGIEIHPGAEIGENFFIDHGSGVVIGETTEIGNNVMLYHRVTLGNDGSKVPPGKR